MFFNQNNIITKRNVILFIFILLLSGNIFLAGQYYISLKNIQISQNKLLIYQHNEKILNFTKLFIEKVLQAQEEVSFEDRLRLENAVRDLNNKDILDQWNKFTTSKTETQAQTEVKNLLELLINKISY